MDIKCNSCGLWKDEEEFNWRYEALGIRHPTCRECQKRFRKNWYAGSAKERPLKNVKERKEEVRRLAREYVLAYLLTHPSIECGEKDPRVLEFHHRDEKDMAVSELVAGGYSIATIQAGLISVMFAVQTVTAKRRWMIEDGLEERNKSRKAFVS